MTKLVEFARNKQAAEFQKALHEALIVKVASAVEARKAELAADIFTEDEVLVEDSGEPHMSDEARELTLHGDNTYHIYRGSHEPIMKNLAKKAKKGIYDSGKATKLWRYHADRVAQDYHKMHGSPDTPWHKMFSTAHRNEAARHWEASNRADVHAMNESWEGITEAEFLGEASKRLTPYDARDVLKQHNALGQDFHALKSSDVAGLVDHAKQVGYRRSNSAPGSTGRMYHQYLTKLADKVPAFAKRQAEEVQIEADQSWESAVAGQKDKVKWLHAAEGHIRKAGVKKPISWAVLHMAHGDGKTPEQAAEFYKSQLPHHFK